MDTKRNIGLDILRVAAAMLVLICHSGFFSVGISFRFLSFGGVLAVEIFFALSGLLVGKSLIQAVVGPEPGKALKKFYVNRLLRMLPLYYIMLLVTAVVSGKGIPLSCFVFLQNFSESDLSFLPVSWSLSVEAWFYFLIPPLFWLLYRLLSGKLGEKRAVYLTIGILCAIPFTLRLCSALVLAPEWDYGIRKQIPLRLDAIMMGVFLAALKRYSGERYGRIAPKGGCLLLSAAGIGGLYLFYCAWLVKESNFDSSPFWKVAFFTLLPLFCCLLVMYMENATWNGKLRTVKAAKLICALSTLSYGVYLIQVCVFSVVSEYFVDARFAVSWLGFLASIALTVVLALAGYRLVEVPSARLRDKWLRKMDKTETVSNV